MSASQSVRTCWVSALVVAFASVAGAQTPAQPRAESPFVLQTPSEWPETPELAKGIAKQLARSVDFGGLDKNGGAAAFAKPQTGIIYVTWLLTTKPADKPEETVRLTLDQLRDSPGPGTEEVEYSETRVGPAIEARMIWRHLANETLTMSRALVWRDAASNIRLLRAECLFSEVDKAAVAPVCGESLATLEATEITAGKVGELAEVAPPKGRAEEADAGPATGDAKAGPKVDAVDPKKPLYENKSENKSAIRDNLWLFLVGGVLIVFAFWASTRGRREDDDDSDSEEPDEAPAAKEEEE